jgi:Arc/MetJ family transcription regulator
MATNLAIDDRLINEARQIGHHATKKAAVTAALQEYVNHRKQLEILELFGTIDYDPDYDIKKMRQLDRIEIEP